MTHSLQIGDVTVPGRVLLAPMTGVTDLPFRRAASRLGAAYVATEMVGLRRAGARAARCRAPSGGRRRAAADGGSAGRERPALDRRRRQNGGGVRRRHHRPQYGLPGQGGDRLRLGLGADARPGPGREAARRRAVGATSRPVTLKMRLGWDDASRNAPELAWRAERAGIKAVTVHGRTRQQFYTGRSDRSAIAAVKAATGLPVIANGDIGDAASASDAIGASGADAVMIGRGAYGRPWIAARVQAALETRDCMEEPNAVERLSVVLDHFRDSLTFYGDALGLKVFRKHLGWYIEKAPWPACAAARRAAKARLCRLDRPAAIEAALYELWLECSTLRARLTMIET